MKRSLLFSLLMISALAALAFGFSKSGENQPLSAQILGDPLPADGFTRVDGSALLSFPDDFGPHPDYQTEWWYYTGNLESQDGRHFGYQLTFFRRALLPASQESERSSEWGTNQIYMAHFALSDAKGDAFYAFERFSRGAAGLAGAHGSPYTVWLEDWRVEQTSASQFTLSAANEEIAINLVLQDEKGPILQGDQGFSPKGPEPGNASYYYSQTRLISNGEITIGDEHIAVEGLSWKDHEFSTSALAPGQIGWDWFSIQLENGYELMLFELRRGDGSIDLLSSGTLISPDGDILSLSEKDFSVSTQGSWKSPHSGANYPMGWQLSIPGADLVLELSPYLEDQELNLSITYWEGAVFVSGMQNGEEVSGQGYVEMTGYADSLEGQF
jgi:predicted secreted hydrolase